MYQLENLTTQTRSKVRGAKFYDVDYLSIHSGDTLEAVREPQNQHDTNAIALYHNGKMVGHIAKEITAGLAPMLDSGKVSLVVEVTGVYTPMDGRDGGINITLYVTHQDMSRLQ